MCVTVCHFFVMDESKHESSTKFVVVTGGVVSGLGKGITVSALGAALQSSLGVKVTAMKIDPYLNVDASTLSPSEHGEVFVTEDGGETDLDLGNYERFLGQSLTESHQLTTGKVMASLLDKERALHFDGKTVQQVPHMRNAVVQWAMDNGRGSDIALIEVGGTVGDDESRVFCHAMRHLATLVPTVFIHLTYVLCLGKEHKTKPTQHSVAALRGLGIIPDVIVLRSERKLEEAILTKVHDMCATSRKTKVVGLETVDDIWYIPDYLFDAGLVATVADKLGLPATGRRPDPIWSNSALALKHCDAQAVRVAVVSKYLAQGDAYNSLRAALKHCCTRLVRSYRVCIEWVDAEEDHDFSPYHGILVPGGFGTRGIKGKLRAIQFAREHNVPFLGICLGAQLAIVDAARISGRSRASSTEFDPHTPDPVVTKMSEGRSMRVGCHDITTTKGSLMSSLYGDTCRERFRHRYGAKDVAGISVTARSGEWVAAVERQDLAFFLGIQFHPEFRSSIWEPAPTLLAFVQASAGLVL